MLFEVKERLEGLEYNIDFGGGSGGTQGKGIGMFTTQKGVIYRSVLTLLSLVVAFISDRLRAMRLLGGKCLFLWINSITYMFTRAKSNNSLILFERGMFLVTFK